MTGQLTPFELREAVLLLSLRSDNNLFQLHRGHVAGAEHRASKAQKSEFRAETCNLVHLYMLCIYEYIFITSVVPLP
jgi:hypothetical protein